MHGARRNAAEDEPQPALVCWFCEEPLTLARVRDEGILRSRSESRGGPFRLVLCPSCLRSNHCEKTPKGRWFSSPPFRPNVVEYFFGRLLSPDPRDFLRSVSWYRENEQRRRYFFERDGDRRYSAGGLLWKIWPRATPETDHRSDSRAWRDAEKGKSASERESRRRETADSGSRRRESRDAPKAPAGGPLVTPWEILGVEEGAGRSEIRRAFYRLAMQYHPDKVHHLGEEFRRIAHGKFTELQAAYEELLRDKPNPSP